MAPQLVRHKQRPPFGGVVKRGQTIVPNLRGGDVCTHNMVPAVEGFLVGFRPTNHPTNSFGSLVPETLGGLNVWQFTANTSNNTVVLELDDGSLLGGQRIPGSTSVTIGYELGVVGLAWNGTNQRYETVDADFTAYLQANVGQDVCLRLSIQRTVPNNYSIEWDTDLIDSSNELAAPFTITNNGTVPGTFEYEAVRLGGTFPIAAGFVDIDEGQSASLTEDVSFLADGTIRITTRGTNAVGTGVTVFDDVTKDTGVAPEFPDDWGRRAAIDISPALFPGAGTLSNFPLFISKGQLPDEMFNSGGPFPALPDGGDLRFTTDEAGLNRIACEIVDFATDPDPANGRAHIFVKVPSVDGTAGTTIYVWWNAANQQQPGDSEPFGTHEVWQEYQAVWHGNSTAAGSNRTGNADWTYVGASINTVDVKQFAAFEFSGSTDDRLETTGGQWMVGAVDRTVTFWNKIKGGDTNQLWGQGLVQNQDGAQNWQHGPDGGGLRPRAIQRASGSNLFADGATAHSINTYNFHGMTMPGGATEEMRIWFNGVDDTLVTAAPGVADTNPQDGFWLGARRTGASAWDRGLNGFIEEFRICEVVRTADWMAAEYNIYDDPGSFLTTQPPVTP